MQALELEKTVRKFLPKEFKVTDWESIKPLFENLKERDISSVKDLREWFQDRSELESAVSEDFGWRYIRMTGDTANKEFTESFNFFVAEIQPHIAPYTNDLNEKALKSVFFSDLKGEKSYDIVYKLLEKDFKIFREKNIPLQTEIQQEEQQFGAISGAMTVEIDGKELTLPQASDILQDTDREKRIIAWNKIAERRFADREVLDNLFNKLLGLRNQVASNADFKNFRDYMFVALGRFYYKPEDCFNFHQAIKQEVVPILNQLAVERKAALNLDELRPWDLNVNYSGNEPLKPFENGADLLKKTIQCFSEIDPYIGQCLVTMQEMNHLDLESRKGKAPGGYNYPLDETGVPFIFMNATTTLRDLVTMVHEGGHALHNFLTRNLELNFFKNPPAEVAELASMAMELISMEHWEIFFPDKKDLNRAKKEHLEVIISTLPWVATVDKFQHWIYENPEHSIEERNKIWVEIHSQFSNAVTSWKGLEKFREYIWQKQLHIYEVPFYYIEYGIAQLGAIAVWKNYRENRAEGLRKYLKALKLGYTVPINEVYEAAGVKFDFSGEYISELMQFVKEELDKCTV
jgi:oligoendopeptidase F